jgi:hydrogenase/urease accessory protein HupE
MRFLGFLITLVLLLALPMRDAMAHAGDATGFASIQVQDKIVRYTLTPNKSSKADHSTLPAFLHDKIIVTADGKRCIPGPASDLTQNFQCDALPQQLSIRDDLPDVLGTTHHVIALITWANGSQSFSFADQSRVAKIDLAASASATTTPTDKVGIKEKSAGSFFLLGIEHIATGYDHLLFLLALILCGGSLVQLLKIITAFTLAHSITLGAAALGIVTLPSTLVESVIALSIAYVAFENLFPRYAISRRWTISFLFGLMHGFGFSSVLQEIGLPRDSLIWSLLNFNLGVEAGQLVAVAVVLPGLLWLRKSAWEARVVKVVSALVLIVGVVLFFERIVI